jgi:hypothetical protein
MMGCRWASNPSYSTQSENDGSTYPEGIESFSPGLSGLADYPGEALNNMIPTLKALHRWPIRMQLFQSCVLRPAVAVGSGLNDFIVTPPQRKRRQNCFSPE